MGGVPKAADAASHFLTIKKGNCTPLFLMRCGISHFTASMVKIKTMKNKHALLIAIGAILSATTFAQDKLTIKPELKHVTVFTSNAELLHETSVNLPQGSSEITFTHVASKIDENTIQIGSTPSVTILSVRAAKDPTTEEIKSPEYLEYEAAFKNEQNKLTELENEKQTEESILKLLESNQKITSDNSGTTVSELIKMTEYYKPKYLAVKNNISTITEKIELQAPLVKLAKARLDELKGQTSAASGQLIVQVMNSSAGIKPFKMTYLALGAGWKAAYDVRAENLKQPLNIVYKANVFQNTGVDWTNVQLQLSTGSPTQGGMLPVLQPLRLYFNKPFARTAVGRAPQLLNEIAVTTTKRNLAKLEMAAPSVVQTENQMYTTFDIEVPYTIISNNKTHAVNLREYETPVTFKYVSAPGIDPGVYLSAELTNYEKLNLIPGEANIFVENMIVGKTRLDPATTADTLLLSMGRDRLIQVKRELVEDLSQVKTFGNNKTQLFTYEISLKNNKKTAVSVELNDQYPLSTDKAMDIELRDKDGASVDAETGILRWNVKMAPGETKNIKFSYSIKYPKDESITL